VQLPAAKAPLPAPFLYYVILHHSLAEQGNTTTNRGESSRL